MSARGTRRPRGRAGAAPGALAPVAFAALAFFAFAAREASAQRSGGAPAPAERRPYSVGARLSRGVAKIGEPVLYRAWITGGDPARVRFAAPDSGGAFTWGPLRATVKAPRAKPAERDAIRGVSFADFDTVWVEAPLQAFATGDLSVPGLAFELDDGSGPRAGRLPMTKLVVAPMLTAADTSARLRGLRGPLAAPWWERVPWTIVALVVLGLGACVAVIVWLRRRLPAPVEAAPVVARDPMTQALAELDALKRLGLPARRRFAEHAFQLGRIVRRFLEATLATPLPGDSTPELVIHLEAARLSGEDLKRIETLMRSWDQVKFARAEASADEAGRAEQSVEGLVRRLGARAPAAESSAGATPPPVRAA
jgi:hypothetical protein